MAIDSGSLRLIHLVILGHRRGEGASSWDVRSKLPDTTERRPTGNLCRLLTMRAADCWTAGCGRVTHHREYQGRRSTRLGWVELGSPAGPPPKVFKEHQGNVTTAGRLPILPNPIWVASSRCECRE